MKIHGKELKTRGSNHKFYQLDDLDHLFELLKKKSVGKLSQELGVPSNSIRHRIMKYFPSEWREKIKVERKHTPK
jgi:hypothetical protein